MIRRLACALALVLSAGSAASCAPADDSSSTTGDSPTTLLAFATTFKGFRTWNAYPVEHPTSNVVHLAGPRTEYINKLPPDGSKSFPVGTIIVKEMDDGALADRKIFAMVKRGGGYNSEGAKDWEWFELQNLDEASVKIIWRGVGPPAGEMYGGDPNASCNSCHKTAAANDFVQSTELSLSNF